MFRPLLLTALIAAPVFAQTVYRWTDARGVVHYTDDKSTAPKGVKVETTDGVELTDIESPKSTHRTAATPADVIPVPPPPDDWDEPGQAVRHDTREDERYWRDAFHSLHEKIRSLEVEIAEDEKIVGDPTQLSINANTYCAQWGTSIRNGVPTLAPGRSPYGSCWYQLNSLYERSRKRLNENRAAIAQAKEDLTDLERRAANNSIPLEWRR